MHRAEAPDQVSGIYSRDVTVGKQVSQNVQCDAVVGIVEDRRQHDAVGDVEVGIAGGQAASFKNDGYGHGEFYDSQGLAVLIGGGTQAANIFAQGLVIGIVRI